MNPSFFLFGHFPNCHHPNFSWEAHNSIFKTKNVIFRAVSRQVEFPEHWGCLSIKTVFSGTEYFVLDGEPFALTPTKYLVLNNEQHYGSYIDSDEDVKSFTINFSQAFIQNACHAFLQDDQSLLDQPISNAITPPEFIQHFYTHDTLLTPILYKIKELTDSASLNPLKLEELYYLLFKALLQKHAATNQILQKAPALKKTTRTELFRRLSRARDYMDSNYAQPISLDNIVQSAYLSTYHFLDTFKAMYGITPYQYLTQVRLQQAKNLLENRDLSVQEVCQIVGYEDSSSFCKLYKKHFGMSPSKTPKEMKKKN